MAKINNVKDLRNKMLESLELFESGKTNLDNFKEITRASSVILTSSKVELMYKIHSKNKDKIDFLETT